MVKNDFIAILDRIPAEKLRAIRTISPRMAPTEIILNADTALHEMYVSSWKDWLTKRGVKLPNTDGVFCNGIHDALIQQIAFKGSSRFVTFNNDYKFYRTILGEHSSIPADRFEWILPDSYVIVSQPSHIDGISTWFPAMLNHCLKVNSKVFVDGAFIGTTFGELDLTHTAIDAISFSLSKAYGVGSLRAGIVFGKELAPTLTTPLKPQFNYYNFTSATHAIKLLTDLNIDFFLNQFKLAQKDVCEILNIEPMDMWMMATTTDESFRKYGRDTSNPIRICITECISELINANKISTTSNDKVTPIPV